MGDRDSEEDYLDRSMPAPGAEPLEKLRDQRFRRSLVEAIANLPEREKQVMSMYYEREMHLKEIGAVLGVTESRVSQLHSQAVARLRGKLKAWL
jgi:RNA polymerase sigma factor for flagellar operon FliA